MGSLRWPEPCPTACRRVPVAGCQETEVVSAVRAAARFVLFGRFGSFDFRGLRQFPLDGRVIQQLQDAVARVLCLDILDQLVKGRVMRYGGTTQRALAQRRLQNAAERVRWVAEQGGKRDDVGKSWGQLHLKFAAKKVLELRPQLGLGRVAF